jgi:dynein heavy chain, axonemal
VNLWLHESERVYSDRLVDPDDVSKFKQVLLSHAKKNFPQYNTSRFYLSGGLHSDPLVFCHFISESKDGQDQMLYDQASSISSLRTVLSGVLKDYNESNPFMDLVLFDDAILHICRIVRIFQQPGGHALLVGVGGSGKQSLARVATFICSYHFVQLNISDTYTLVDFKSDIQSLFHRAGIKQEGVVFFLTDTQVNNERMLIDINDMLSGIDMPNLFNRDEKDSIVGLLASKAKADGYSSEPGHVWSYFLSQVRRNLRICLSFSPMGNMLRVRALRFPAIISSTTIDWFRPWNEQALVSVGRKKLASLISDSPDIARAVEHFIPQTFLAVNHLSKTFLREEGRYVYNTPKSYLEMISLFQTMMHIKSKEAEAGIRRLQSGVEKLLRAENDVVELEEKLQVMLATAEEKRLVSEKAAADVQAERVMVELENEKVRVEEMNVATIQGEVSIKYEDAAKDLQQAEPALMRAMGALDSLDRRDLGNCRTMSKPPSGVDDVFAAVMVLLAGVNPNIIVQKNGKVREKERTWEASKKALLGNINNFMVMIIPHGILHTELTVASLG